MIRVSLLALALLAAACTPPTSTATDTATTSASTPTTAGPTTKEEATAQDTCHGAQYHSFIGQNAAAITVPAGSVRFVMPDTVVTQDFRPDRINIIANAQGVITSIECY